MTPEEIKALRKALTLNTRNFGKLTGVCGKAVEAWEYGVNKPSGAALVLLNMVKKTMEKDDGQ